MNSKRKKIAIFGSCFTGRYRQNLSRSFNIAAEELNVDLYQFNSLGKIGDKNAIYGDYESGFLDYVDLDVFDGIIFDGEGYNVDGMANKIIRKLRSAKCAVVSISSHVDGFYILPSVAKCPKDILQAAKQPKAALRLCRGQYDVALAALCAAPPSLTADFKMSFRHFEIAR